jgi:T3SS negative regulator,GrlR
MQNFEALWSAVFTVPRQGRLNAGVVIFETGRLFGGDSWYYYTGTYGTNNAGKVTAKFQVKHYAGQLGSPSMGMLPEGTYVFEETAQGQDTDGNRTIDAKGTVVGLPGAPPVLACLTWRAALP